jgi:adenylate cyclase
MMTRQLTDAGASAVAYDIIFSEPDRTAPARLAERAQRSGASPQALAALKAMPDPDRAFADTIKQSPVVLGYFLTQDGKGPAVEPEAGMAVAGTPPTGAVANYTNSIQPLPILRAPAAGLGFVSLPPDSDGIIRRAPLLAAEGDQLLPSLSVDALRVAQGAGAVTVKSSDASGEIGSAKNVDVTAIKTGNYEAPTTPAGELWMYYTAPHPERVVPAWKLLTGALPPAEMQKLFAGRIVFVGASAQGLYDLKSTPMVGREMGVAIHAQAVEQMVFHQFLTRPYWGEAVERGALLILGLLLALLLPWLGATRGAVLGLVMVGGMGAGSWLAFKDSHLLLDPTWPVLGLTAVFLIETVFTYYREERQRAYIHRAFDRYLSPELVKRIADDPSRLQLGGEEREMTVLFCDIRQFSRISERLGPQEIIRFLIAFLTPMCDILLARHATIDKFIGDAILAFWNAPLDDPDQYRNAARGALEMGARLRQLNATMSTQSAEPWPGEVHIGIGLNAGPCCVGNMGSAQRLSYSLIGDTVNLASRIEGLTKYYGVEIAIGEALHAHLPDFACLELDRVRVVGRDAPETVFVLLGDETLAESEAFQAFAAAHAELQGAYRAQDLARAKALADAGMAAAGGYGLTKFYALMQGRIAHFADSPPAQDWVGVFEATEK